MFYSREALESMGFKSVGENALISDKAVFYGVDRISIGDNTRIDDFSILSAGPGGITLGRNVHIACYVSIIGKEAIVIDDFSRTAAGMAQAKEICATMRGVEECLLSHVWALCSCCCSSFYECESAGQADLGQ